MNPKVQTQSLETLFAGFPSSQRFKVDNSQSDQEMQDALEQELPQILKEEGEAYLELSRFIINA